MSIRFITNEKGEGAAVIIPIAEYEDLLHQHHLGLETIDGYKTMIEKCLMTKRMEPRNMCLIMM